jgi:putative PIN family toxin of toxin-antitoxin system
VADELRVLVDSSVWISALINEFGFPGRVLAAAADGHYVPVYSQAALDDLRRGARKPRLRERYGLTEERVERFIALLIERGVEVHPTGHLRLCRDPTDDIMLETALLGSAQYVVSRDDDMKWDPELITRMREQGVEVLSVTRFLRLLESPA